MDEKIVKQALNILKYKEEINFSEGVLLERFMLNLKFIKEFANRVEQGDYYTINEYKIKKNNGKPRNIVAPCKEFIIDNRKVLNFFTNCEAITKYASNYKLGIHTLYNTIEPFSRKIKDFPYILKIDIKNAFESTDLTKVIKLFEKILNIRLYENTGNRELYNFLLEFIFDIQKVIMYKGKIPQGFPTSKLIFDCIMNKVDWNINKIYKNSISYFRYVDDIAIFIDNKQNPTYIKDACLRAINRIGYSINNKKMQIIDRIKNKKITMFLGACIHHPNDVSKENIQNNDTKRKIKIKKRTRNRYRSYKYLADKYQIIDSIAVRDSMKGICE